MQKQQYETHPAATLFPMMTEEEYQGLKQDIAENGQREDIVVWQGKLIDGRNRLRACEELGKQPSVAELDDDEDPWKYVISHNLHRRHLTTSQRAMVASKLADMKKGDTLKKGTKTPEGQNCTSVADAAKALNVSPRSVKTAKTVQERGSESVKQAVEQGKIPVSTAAKLVKEVPDKQEQTKIVEQGTQAVKEKVKESRKPKTVVWVDVEDDEDCTPAENASKEGYVDKFLRVWNDADETGKRAIWLWLCDNYEGTAS